MSTYLVRVLTQVNDDRSHEMDEDQVLTYRIEASDPQEAMDTVVDDCLTECTYHCEPINAEEE